MSFEAHYRLASIHPWADGNGRMDKRDALRKDELVKAITRSNRTYEEVMEFLANEGNTLHFFQPHPAI